MRFKRTALAVIVVAFAVWQWALRTKHRAETSLAELSSQRSALESEIREAELRRTAEMQKLEELRRLAAVPASTAAKPPLAVPQTPPRPMPPSQSELISTDPKLEILSLNWSRAVIGLEYGPFYRTLGLSDEQIRKFEENHLKQDELAMDLAAVAKAKGEAGKATAAMLREQTKAAYEAAQIEVLGVDGFRRAEEYMRTLVPRNVFVLGLAGAAAVEDIPITAQQGDQLWKAALKAGPTDPNVNGSDLLVGVDWDRLDAEAQRILTPAQLELFKNVAVPSGFQSRAEIKAKDVIRRAQEADTAAAQTSATK